jgi:Ca2+-transporting ATPase
MPYFPIFIDLCGNPCLIVGGGAVAARKAEKLLPYGPRLTVVAPEPCSALTRMEGVTLLPRAFVPEDVSGMALVIAAATIAAFHLGLSVGGASVGSTMAFATLCLSRLFHGFNCKSHRPVLLRAAFFNNRTLLSAFAVGVLLLAAVLLIPGLSPLLQVTSLPSTLLAAIAALAFGSLLVIQFLKLFRKQ